MDSVCENILKICTTNGISKDGIEKSMNTVPKQTLARSINYLLQAGKIDMCKSNDGSLAFKLREEKKNENASSNNLDLQERLIYKEIQKVNGNGITAVEIGERLSLKTKIVNDFIKSLEKNNYIKQVKCPQQPRRKFYISTDAEASDKLTGGVMYDDEGNVDFELLDTLQKLCLRFLMKKKAAANDSMTTEMKKISLEINESKTYSYAKFGNQKNATVEQMAKHLNSLNVCRVLLSDENVEKILDVCVDDGKAFRSKIGNIVYYEAKEIADDTLTSYASPCEACQLFDQCGLKNEINFRTCKYLDEFLSF